MKQNEFSDNKELQYQAFQAFRKDDKVLYAVLKRLGIRRTNPDYDDLVSEGRLLYIRAYMKLHDSNSPGTFSYYYTKVYWGLLDILRRQAHFNGLIKLSEKDDGSQEWLQIASPVDLVNDYEYRELLALIKKACTDNEWFFLQQRLAGKKIKEIADMAGVSRQTVHKWHLSLQHKVKRICAIQGITLFSNQQNKK